MDQELLAYLLSFVTENKQRLFREVLAGRTRYLTLVLEDISQPHNASATLRSAECFGIQDVHIIENRHEYNLNPYVTRGSSKWLTLHRYNTQANNTKEALHWLKENGYRIIAATPHHQDVPLEGFDMDAGKAALVFGSEFYGLSEETCTAADEFLHIPMSGFTESLNISVSVAVVLHHLSWKLRNSQLSWRLSREETDALLLEWVKKTIKRPDLIIGRFYEARRK